MQSMHQLTGTKSMQNNETWGLVVGKFAPYHKGHRYLIAQASASCTHLIVLSYAKPDFGFSATSRMKAINKDFPEVYCVFYEDIDSTDSNVGLDQASELPLPHNDERAYVHRAFCADILLTSWPRLKLDYVFSSEDYGDGFAEYLSFRMKTHVKHVMIDQSRINYPVSATKLRNGELEWNQWSLM